MSNPILAFVCALLAFRFSFGAQAEAAIGMTNASSLASTSAGNRVDASTMLGKILCGYQGWFGAPNDGSPQSGWRHWATRPFAFKDGNAKVDFWPDLSELAPEERFATGFLMTNGRPAEVFSSYQRATVVRHFQWMQQYGIDGVFIQRFAVQLQGRRNSEFCDTVLANCREGANRHGRVYAIMYDLSGLSAGHIEEVMNDWRNLRTRRAITADPAYLHHHAKPVVAVWGIGFNDHRNYTLEECGRLIKFLKDDPAAGGCTVMLGVPAYWRELRRDAVHDPQLLEVLKLADVLSPWSVGRYVDVKTATDYIQQVVRPDLAWCKQRQIDYMPVAFPGFSRHNMYGGPLAQIPRAHGQFFWSQLAGLQAAGAAMIYVAMFDEVDEGTAIFKCANSVPLGDESQFVTFEGLPSDFYLKMVGTAAKQMRGDH